jgi:hypothetical protein
VSSRRDGEITNRTWLRSHEEENGPTRVYRPANHAFPPARGREGFTLHPDGRFDHLGPGRGDRPETTAGTWQRNPDDDTRITATVGGRTIDLRITREADDLLHVEWSTA